MTKYFCEFCQKEIKDVTDIYEIKINNKFDVFTKPYMFEHEICLRCAKRLSLELTEHFKGVVLNGA